MEHQTTFKNKRVMIEKKLMCEGMNALMNVLKQLADIAITDTDYLNY